MDEGEQFCLLSFPSNSLVLERAVRWQTFCILCHRLLKEFSDIQLPFHRLYGHIPSPVDVQQAGKS